MYLTGPDRTTYQTEIKYKCESPYYALKAGHSGKRNDSLREHGLDIHIFNCKPHCPKWDNHTRTYFAVFLFSQPWPLSGYSILSPPAVSQHSMPTEPSSLGCFTVLLHLEVSPPLPKSSAYFSKRLVLTSLQLPPLLGLYGVILATSESTLESRVLYWPFMISHQCLVMPLDWKAKGHKCICNGLDSGWHLNSYPPPSKWLCCCDVTACLHT